MAARKLIAIGHDKLEPIKTSRARFICEATEWVWR